MPTIVEVEVDGYVHCALPRCEGNQQEKVKAVKREVSQTYAEEGGNIPGVYRSWVTYHVDDEVRPCPSCGKPREVSDQPRKTYASMSGYDPMGLIGSPAFNAAKQPSGDAALQAEVAELRAMVSALKGE